ncbi:MAG: 3-keto-5-aminohexanoate cleavage protein [Candidatus Atabeyarchaeum deiterrae]
MIVARKKSTFKPLHVHFRPGCFLQGGHIRVDPEDFIRNINGELAKSNQKLVAQARQLVEHCSLDAATPDKTRQILKLRQKQWAILSWT